MRTLLLLNCYLLLIGYSLGDNDGNCIIDGIENADYQTIYPITIDDTQIDSIITENQYSGLLDIVSETYSTDFDLSTNATHFIIKTTPDFATFDSRTSKQDRNAFLVKLDIVLRCPDGFSSLSIQIAVTDINTHPPQFSQEKYEFKVPTPIMPLTDFSIYGDIAISATDIDFSNQQITFTVEPDDFSVVTQSSLTSKDYGVAFAARRVVQITGERIYTITATDSGTNPGPLSSSTSITFTVDADSSLDTPLFDHASYSFNYTVEDSTPKLIPLDGPITIATNKRSSLTNPTLTGDYNEFFAINLDTAASTIDFTLPVPPTPFPTDTGSFIILTLSVSTDSTASTGVVVYIQDAEIDAAPQFNSRVYTGSYSDITTTVTLDRDIIITSGTTPDVQLSGDDLYADYFAISLESDAYVVSVSKPLLPEILEGEVSIALTIVAAVDGNEGYATLVINLPATVKDRAIDFVLTLYDGIYEIVDGTGRLQITDTIQVETDEDDANIEYIISSDTGYEDYFRISYSNKIVTVTLDHEIPNNLLTRQSFIPLLLTVGITGTRDQSTAVLNVDIASNEENNMAIVLSNVLYHGRYEVTDGVGALTIDDDITVDTEEVDAKVYAIITNEYATLFNVDYSGKAITITLRDQLTTEILNSHTFIPLTLQVGIEDTTIQDSSVLNIQIIDDGTSDTGSIEFTAILYGGEYSVSDGKGNFVLNEEIDVITDSTDDEITPSISNDAGYERYFTISYASNTVTIGLVDDLPPEVLENSFISLTLRLAITGTTHSSSAVLNINIDNYDERRSIAFSTILYNGKYEVTDGTGDLTIGDQITVDTTEADSNVDVSIPVEYETYFTASYSSKVITVTLQRQLPPAILTNSVIPLKLQVSIKGTSIQAAAVLNIEIKYDSDVDTGSIEFTEILYSGEYSVDGGNLILNEAITVITDRNDDEITTSISNDLGYSKYFTISYASNTVTINLAEDLPQEVLDNSFIALTLTVGINHNTHSSSAVLNIIIDGFKHDDTQTAIFSNILYNGHYEVTDGTGALSIDDRISVVTNEPDSNIVVGVSNEYASYFSASYSSKVITVILNQDLSDNILKSNSFIPLTLRVEVVGTSNLDNAVVNIKIKNNDDNNGNTDLAGDVCPMKTAYISSIVVLSILIIALIAAAIAFYYFRIRNRSYSNLDEERDSRTRYDKNLTTRPSSDVKQNNPLDERRPTGFIFKPLNEDVDATNDVDKRRKSVAFDDKKHTPIAGPSSAGNE